MARPIDSTMRPAAPAAHPRRARLVLVATATLALGVAAASPAAAAPVPAPQGPSSCSGTTYVLPKGANWYGLAKSTGVKLSVLLKANKATIRTKLYPGRSICLPAGAKVPTTSSSSTTTTSTTVPKGTTKSGSGTTSTTSTTTVPVKAYSRAESEAIIRSIWPADVADIAVAIATRESNLQNTAKNSCCYGLFQIHYTANQKLLNLSGITSAAQLLDPTSNAYLAYSLFLRSGWAPWGGPITLPGATTTTTAPPG